MHQTVTEPAIPKCFYVQDLCGTQTNHEKSLKNRLAKQ